MEPSSRRESIEALRELGFTEMEADVYLALMQVAPATAYRLAQQVGKAAANVYKAVESLQRKGAVLVDDSENRLCRPVALDDLLRHIESQFKAAKDRAAQVLANLDQAGSDERVYQLRSREQVMERARSLVRRSKEIVLCDLFPRPVDELRVDLEAAARRGCRVFVQVYQPTEFCEPMVVFDKREGKRQLKTWPGEWLNIVGDAQEHLLALLRASDGGVHRALWSESKYLSVLYHSGLKSEMAWGAIGSAILSGASPEEVRDQYKQLGSLTQDMNLPGYVDLLAQFGAPPPPPPELASSQRRAPTLSTRRKVRG